MYQNKQKKIDTIKHNKEKSSNTLYKRLSKCKGKVSHSNEYSAKIALNKQLEKSIQADKPIISQLNTYECEKCGSWHVGRNKQIINWNLIKELDQRNHTIDDPKSTYKQSFDDLLTKAQNQFKNSQNVVADLRRQSSIGSYRATIVRELEVATEEVKLLNSIIQIIPLVRDGSLKHYKKLSLLLKQTKSLSIKDLIDPIKYKFFNK